MKTLGVIDRLYDKKISSKGLAIFRICFALTLFFEVLRIFKYRALYNDPIPFLEPATTSLTITLLLWLIVLVFITFGLFTRVMAIINYVFAVVIFHHLAPFEYHMYYTYCGIGFLMMFIPLAQSFSIDALIKKIKYSNTIKQFVPEQKTPVLYYFMFVFFGIAVVYFDSLFYKFECENWMNGLALWLAASIPHVTALNDQWLLNNEYLMKTLGYLTFAFELLFPFIFFIKRFRLYLLIIGLGLHFGILIEFPIPFFALGVIAIYILMVPVSFWDILERKFQFKNPKLHFFYDAECPLCVRTKIIISHFDVFNAIAFKSVQEFASTTEALKGLSEKELLDNIYSVDNKKNVRSGVSTYKKVSQLVPAFYPVAILFLIPGVSFIANKIYSIIAKNRTVQRCTEDSCGVPELKQPIEENNHFIFKNKSLKSIRLTTFRIIIICLIGLQLRSTFNFVLSYNTVKQNIPSSVYDLNRVVNRFSTKYFGITKHGVFVDEHFVDFDKIVSLKYNDTFLPMFKPNGLSGQYLKGGVWTNYLFRVNGPNIINKQEKLKKGLIRYASFWAHKNNVNLEDANFKVVMKRIRYTFKWEKDLLTNNLATPWEEVGEINWSNNKAIVNLKSLK